MPLFAPRRTVRRKDSRSPSPEPLEAGTAGSSGGGPSRWTSLRSRGGTGHSSSTMAVPYGGSRPASSSTAAQNSFLLGGMSHVADRRRQRRRKRHRPWLDDHGSRSGSSLRAILFGSHDRRRRIVLRLVLFCGSVIFVVVVVLWMGVQRDSGTGILIQRLLPTSSSSEWWWSQHRQPRPHGTDWLRTDSSVRWLDKHNHNNHAAASTPTDVRAAAEHFAMERERARKQDGASRLEVLEALAWDWYHRNENDRSPTIAEDVAVNEEHELDNNNNSERQRQIAEDHPHQRQLRTLHTSDELPNTSRCPATLDDSELDTTLVLQSSLDRVWIVGETCRRWTGPIVLVIAVRHDGSTQDALETFLTQWSKDCPRLHPIVHRLDVDATPDDYPVNALRNLALDAVQTSHVLVADIDFVPSMRLDDTIRAALPSLESSSLSTTTPKTALVVPALERLLHPPCTSDADCRRHWQADPAFMPSTMSELRECFRQDDCGVFQGRVNPDGHSSTQTEAWLDKNSDVEHDTENTNDGKDATRTTIPCFDSLRYEPYVVVRWCPPTSKTDPADATSPTVKNRPVPPYYDERFHGYGKNKIQWVTHLRVMGYQFQVLSKGFLLHHPHVESAVKERWNAGVTDRENTNLHQRMDALYAGFLKELVHKYFGDIGTEGLPYNIVEQCQP